MRTPIFVPNEILRPYVTGKVFEYFSGSEKAPEAEGIHNYVNRTLEFVIPYLAGKEVLDIRASDYQCQIAQSAYFDFKQMFETHVLIANRTKVLLEVQAKLRSLGYKTHLIAQALESIAKAQMNPEEIDEKAFSSKFRSLALHSRLNSDTELNAMFLNVANAYS